MFPLWTKSNCSQNFLAKINLIFLSWNKIQYLLPILGLFCASLEIIFYYNVVRKKTMFLFSFNLVCIINVLPQIFLKYYSYWIVAYFEAFLLLLTNQIALFCPGSQNYQFIWNVIKNLLTNVAENKKWKEKKQRKEYWRHPKSILYFLLCLHINKQLPCWVLNIL